MRSTRSPSVSLQYEPRTSPFIDCRGAFHAYPLMMFKLPPGGQVNGYLKFQGSSRSHPSKSTKPIRRTKLSPDDESMGSDVIILCDTAALSDPLTSASPSNAGTAQMPAQPESPFGATHDGALFEGNDFGSPSSFMTWKSVQSSQTFPAIPSTAFNAGPNVWLGEPGRPLPLFPDSVVSMDDMGMRLWNFCEFLTGRCICSRC